MESFSKRLPEEMMEAFIVPSPLLPTCARCPKRPLMPPLDGLDEHIVGGVIMIDLNSLPVAEEETLVFFYQRR
jgi:hypothetical protein